MDPLYLNAFSVLFKGRIGALQEVHDTCDGDFHKAWQSDLSSVVASFSKEQITTWIEEKRTINPEHELELLHKSDITILTQTDPNYPQLLKNIIDPPFMLYTRGNQKALLGNCLSIVGTRKATDYGIRVATKIAESGVHHGLTIVSGLAAGIDTVAHRATVDISGSTIAVLGCGLDDRTIFPQQNLRLARQIIDTGSILISEYAPTIHGTRYTFPQRNRIISGLSRGTVVVEADIKSGSLITARSAVDQNRDVYAIPGSIFSKGSEGTHHIIKQGAKLVTSAQDILEDYGVKTPQQSELPIAPRTASPEEQKILDSIARSPLPIDDIIRKTKLSASVVQAQITIMELKGFIKNLDNTIYIN